MRYALGLTKRLSAINYAKIEKIDGMRKTLDTFGSRTNVKDCLQNNQQSPIFALYTYIYYGKQDCIIKLKQPHMKRFTSIITIALALFTLMSVTSCQSKDERLAYYLDGIWEGYIIGNGKTYEATIEFVQEGFYDAYGYGYEWDTGWSHGRTKRTYFEWYVQNRNIFIHYEDMAYGTYIVMDYDRLPRSTAEGVTLNGAFIDDYTGEWLADFRLRKMYNHENYYTKEGAFDPEAIPAE